MHKNEVIKQRGCEKIEIPGAFAIFFASSKFQPSQHVVVGRVEIFEDTKKIAKSPGISIFSQTLSTSRST